MEDMTGHRPPDMHEDNWREPALESPKDVKEIYRTIVRQLHPDMNGQMDDSKAALWHEAQEAYRRNDVAALNSVLGRCKEISRGTRSGDSLSDDPTARNRHARCGRISRRNVIRLDFARPGVRLCGRIRVSWKTEQINHQLTAMTTSFRVWSECRRGYHPTKPNRRNPWGGRTPGPAEECREQKTEVSVQLRHVPREPPTKSIKTN
jgi:hypothetical protein